MKKIIKDEKGDIILLFAGTLIILIAFLALATDVVLAFTQRDRLREVGSIIRNTRLDIGEELWNSDNPEAELKKLADEIGRQNGLKSDQIHVRWKPVQRNMYKRVVDIRITLVDTYQCTTLKMLGINELPIRVDIDGYQAKRTSNIIWHPGMY